MSFNRLAPHYDWLEAVTAGSRLERARTQWLDTLAGCRHILSVGEGHGRFAAACLARFPHANLTCVETSPAMMAVGRRKTRAWADRVKWECADVLAWQPPQKYDAIVTCFFLDCFPPETLDAVVRRLAGSAVERAVWLVTDFAIPAAGPARFRAEAIHALMYAFFRVCVALPARRMTAPDTFLAQRGFKLTGRRDFEWGLLRADVWSRGAIQ